MEKVAERLVFCRSAGRREKELAIRSRAEDRLLDELRKLLGCYVLRTNHDELDGERLWTLYMTLAKAEEGFRMLKSDLGLRPNHHQLEDRVDAHIFITVLAHKLLNAIIHTMSSAGDVRSWPMLKRILQTHCYTTMLLPTTDGTLHRIRRAGAAEAEQQKIYEILGVDYRNLSETKISVPMTNSSIL